MELDTDYKYGELYETVADYIKDNYTTDELVELYIQDKHELIEEIHHRVFNENYYIIGTYKAKKWLDNQGLNILSYIQKYQAEQFGSEYIETFRTSDNDIDYERIVNMYAYIKGLDVVNGWFDDWARLWNNFDAWLGSEANDAKEYIKYSADKYKRELRG